MRDDTPPATTATTAATAATTPRSGRATRRRTPAHDTPWCPRLVELYEQEFERLVALACRYVDRRVIGEEIVQDAFVRFHTAPNPPEAGHELAFLRTIVLNLSRSWLRRQRVARAWTPEPPRSAPDAESEWMTLLGLDAARSLVARLPARQREVLACRHLLDLSEQETASLLRITVGAVKSHGARARATLRALVA